MTRTLPGQNNRRISYSLICVAVLEVEQISVLAHGIRSSVSGDRTGVCYLGVVGAGGCVC